VLSAETTWSAFSSYLPVVDGVGERLWLSRHGGREHAPNATGTTVAVVSPSRYTRIPQRLGPHNHATWGARRDARSRTTTSREINRGDRFSGETDRDLGHLTRMLYRRDSNAF
jgi:hypothetical protein